MFEHSLDASLYLHQIVANVNTWNPYLHMCLISGSLYPPPSLLPPPPPPSLPLPVLSSCLAPLSHRYRRHRRFRCSLLIVVCPRRCAAAFAAYNRYRLRRRRFRCSLLIVGYPRRSHFRRRRCWLSTPPPLLAIAAAAVFTALC